MITRLCLLLCVALLLGGCGSCGETQTGSLSDAGHPDTSIQDDVGPDDDVRPDDDTGPSYRPAPPFTHPVAGGGEANSPQHKLRLRIGRSGGEANTNTNKLQIEGH